MLLHRVYQFLSFTSLGIVLIPLILCLIRLKALNKTVRVLLIYLVVCAITEAASYAFKGFYEYYKITQTSFTGLEFFLLSYIYYLEFRGKLAKKIILSLVFFYTAFAIIVLTADYPQPNGLLSAVESCIMMSFSIAFFYKVQSEMNIPKLREYSFIAINSAVLIYFSTALVLFLSAEFLDHCPQNIFQVLWGLHDVGNIIFNIFLSIGIWRQKK
jgi:hypothetical protein